MNSIPLIPIGAYANQLVTWMETHLGLLFKVIEVLFNHTEAVPLYIFTHPPVIVVVVGFVILAVVIRGVMSGVWTAVGAFLIMT